MQLQKESVMFKSVTAMMAVAATALLLGACGGAPKGEAQAQAEGAKAAGQHKIGVLLVNHGSRQKAWRDMLVDVEKATKDRLLAMPNVKGVKTGWPRR